MRKPLVNLAGGVAAGISGGLAFLVFLLILKIHPLIAALAAVAVFAGVTLLVPPEKRKKPMDNLRELMNSTLEEGYKKLAELRSYSARIKKASMKSDIEVLCLNFENIMEEYRANPDRFKVILGYYLESITSIVRQYVELTRAGVGTAETEDAVLKCEKIIRTANETLTNQLENRLEDDAIDLNAEISVLEKTLKTEGFK